MQIETKHFLPISKQEALRFFTEKHLVEQWARPEGTTLKVPFMDVKPGGKYRYEHSTESGKFVADGYFEEIGPNRVVQFDEVIRDPSGKVVSKNLECVITFTERDGGTDVKVATSGFTSNEEANNCEKGWQQCLANLDSLLKSAGLAA